MIAVFGMKSDFAKLQEELRRESKHYKLVTDNIEHEFVGCNVEGLVFLPEHTKGYVNLMKIYTKVLAYVRGPRSEKTVQQLKHLIEIEITVERIRCDMTKIFLLNK